MNRRTFFAATVGALSLPAISKIRERQREAEIRSILRLKDELSAGVRKATRELKKLNQKLNHDPMRWSSGLASQKVLKKD
jgi:hypothetical protein